MRIHLPETTLRLIADAIASTVVIRSYDRHGSVDTRRPSTQKQRQAVKTAAYAGLLGLNWGEDNRSDKGREDAILNTVEFMVAVADTGSADLNGYDTIYNPMKAVTEAWRLASERTWNGSYTDVFTKQFSDLFPAWCNVIDGNFEYCQDDDWTPLDLDDAAVQLDGMKECGALEEIPEEQQDAGLLYLVWNVYVLNHLKGGN